VRDPRRVAKRYTPSGPCGGMEGFRRNIRKPGEPSSRPWRLIGINALVNMNGQATTGSQADEENLKLPVGGIYRGYPPKAPSRGAIEAWGMKTRRVLLRLGLLEALLAGRPSGS